MSRAWRLCWPACRTNCPAPPSTGCAAPAWTRSAPPRAPSRAGDAELMIAGGVESMTRAPFVMGKATEAVRPLGRDLRHDHRLALRQPADEGANTVSMRCRRQRRTSPRTTRSAAPTRTPSPGARRQRAKAAQAARLLRARNRPGGHRGTQGHRSPSSRDEHPRGETTIGGPCETEDAVPQSKAAPSPPATRRASTTAPRP